MPVLRESASSCLESRPAECAWRINDPPAFLPNPTEERLDTPPGSGHFYFALPPDISIPV